MILWSGRKLDLRSIQQQQPVQSLSNADQLDGEGRLAWKRCGPRYGLTFQQFDALLGKHQNDPKVACPVGARVRSRHLRRWFNAQVKEGIHHIMGMPVKTDSPAEVALADVSIVNLSVRLEIVMICIRASHHVVDYNREVPFRSWVAIHQD